MSDQTQNQTSEKQLTLEDPVPNETVQAFRQIQSAQVDLALELMRLEQRKVQLLAASKKLGDQHDRLFQSILVERGQHPQTPAELDAKTGRILLKIPPEAPAPEEAPPTP